jgi:hypothetical protein
VTDTAPPEPIIELCRNGGVQLEIASSQPEPGSDGDQVQ